MPASSNIGSAEYPRMDSDLRVTFRLRVPNARQVKLEGVAAQQPFMELPAPNYVRLATPLNEECPDLQRT